MKKIFSCIAKNLGVILFCIALLCLYAVLQINFACFVYVGTVANPDKINSIIETLSFSYIAAYFFYELTIQLPWYVSKIKLLPIIRTKVHDLGAKQIRSILREFSSGTEIKYDYHNIDNVAEILRSKNWDAIIPIYKQFEGISISYFGFLISTSRQLRGRADMIVSRYKENLTIDQIVALEKFSDLHFFSLVESLGCYTNLIVNDGRESIIEEFIKMQRAYLKIEKMFK